MYSEKIQERQNKMDRREETREVKKALKKEGIKAKVSHARGTAYGWIEIDLGNPKDRNGVEVHPRGWGERFTDIETALHEQVISIVQTVTGRHGKYDGKISIYTQ